SAEVLNMLEASDTFILGVEFSGTESAQVYASSYYNYTDPTHAAAGDSAIKKNYSNSPSSLAELIAATVPSYWQDAGNNRVWIKVFGGIEPFESPDDIDQEEFSDEILYQPFRIRVY
ncbi:MAG: hypothetical protein KDK66_08515, partial [Deltaproteobacteria bacterium]|nr:hypothetical protein [Deltaproteobacteria bacterium]